MGHPWQKGPLTCQQLRSGVPSRINPPRFVPTKTSTFFPNDASHADEDLIAHRPSKLAHLFLDARKRTADLRVAHRALTLIQFPPRRDLGFVDLDADAGLVGEVDDAVHRLD